MGIDDLEQHIKFEIVYSPEVWKERFNLAKGAAFSLSHNFAQVGYLRPHNRHRRYRNLYFTGGRPRIPARAYPSSCSRPN